MSRLTAPVGICFTQHTATLHFKQTTTTTTTTASKSEAAAASSGAAAETEGTGRTGRRAGGAHLHKSSFA